MRRTNHFIRTKYNDRRTAFHIALAEYTFDNFEWHVIGRAKSQEELDKKEKFWIKQYKADDPQFGYNSTEGGSAGFKLLVEHKRKISASHIGICPTDETRKKLSEAAKGNKKWLGKKHTDETKRKIGEASKNRSLETRKKLRRANSKLTEAQVYKIKTALASGETGVSLAKKYGVTAGTISYLKSGKTWSHIP
jgi:group I intron endonuclease